MPSKIFKVTSESRRIYLSENVKGGAPERNTTVDICLSEGALRVRFECEDDFILSRGNHYNAKLYEGDVVELFVTLGRKNRYLELEVNPDGMRYAVIVDNVDGSLTLSPMEVSPFTSHTEATVNGWRSEWVIPLNGLKEIGFDLDNALFNLYRQDFRKDGSLMLYALNPTYSASFHVPDAFVTLGIDN